MLCSILKKNFYLKSILMTENNVKMQKKNGKKIANYIAKNLMK